MMLFEYFQQFKAILNQSLIFITSLHNFQNKNKKIKPMTQIIPTKFKKSPSFSFRAKFNTDMSTNSPQHLPSPNLYKPQKSFKNQPKVKFSKSPRKSVFDKKMQKSPGPGQYQSNTLKDKSHFSVQSQAKLRTFTERFHKKLQTRPGPGAYDIKVNLRKTLPTFSMASKFKTPQQIQMQKNSFKPSPGAYDVQSSLVKSFSVTSIPKSPRMKQTIVHSPGPGRYQSNQNLLFSQKSFGKRTFSNFKRQISFDIKNQSPGPGKYVAQTDFQISKRKKIGFTCRDRLFQTKRQFIPGPGQYQSHSNLKFKSTQSCKMPKAEKKLLDNFKTQKTPGPGMYDNLTQSYDKVNFSSRSAPKFSKAKLQTLSLVKPTGCQQIYESKINFIKKSSNSYSIGSQQRKSFFQKVAKLPGPCEYNPEDKMTRQKVLAPKFSMAARPNAILNKLKVGPGQYHNEQLNTSINSKGTKFSKSKRTLDLSSIQNQDKSVLRIQINTYSNTINSSRLNTTK